MLCPFSLESRLDCKVSERLEVERQYHVKGILFVLGLDVLEVFQKLCSSDFKLLAVETK
jgi:hypothetical protein